MSSGASASSRPAVCTLCAGRGGTSSSPQQEEAVSLLVAQGLSTREVAAELVRLAEDRAVPPRPHPPSSASVREQSSAPRVADLPRGGGVTGARVHRVGCRNTPAAVHDPRAVRPQRHHRCCRPLVASRLLAPPPHRVPFGAGGGELGGKHVRLRGGKGKPQQMPCWRRGRFIATPNDCGFDHRHVPGKRQHSDLVAADGSHR